MCLCAWYVECHSWTRVYLQEGVELPLRVRLSGAYLRNFPLPQDLQVVILMVCGSYPELYWIPCELDCFQMVPLLRIVLTSSASSLLSRFPHESVAVLSSAASLRICHGQICTLSKHTCLHISCQAGLLSYLPYLPSSKGVANPWTQQETNESASKSLSLWSAFLKVAGKLCFPPGPLCLLLAALRHHRFLLVSIVKPFPFLSLFRVSYNCNS